MSVTEGNSGTVNAVFTVALSSQSGQNVSVGFATADGTDHPAVVGVDYNNAAGSLLFTPGQTTKSVTVQTKSDTLD